MRDEESTSTLYKTTKPLSDLEARKENANRVSVKCVKSLQFLFTENTSLYLSHMCNLYTYARPYCSRCSRSHRVCSHKFHGENPVIYTTLVTRIQPHEICIPSICPPIPSLDSFVVDFNGCFLLYLSRASEVLFLSFFTRNMAKQKFPSINSFSLRK